MDMTGERLILASRAKVWEALNNTEILKACIPGCESLEATSPTQMKAVAGVKLGPISAKFTGDVTLSDLDPPNGYTISGEGRGGVAGFAKGGAKVELLEQGEGTLLSYTVNAQVGGKIAQLGARLIDATAKSMAEQFFSKFAARVEPDPASVSPAPDETVTALSPTPAETVTMSGAPTPAMTAPPPVPATSISNARGTDISGAKLGLWFALAAIAVLVIAGLWYYG